MRLKMSLLNFPLFDFAFFYVLYLIDDEQRCRSRNTINQGTN